MVERKIKRRDEVEVFLNKYGAVVIQQTSLMGEESTIFVNPEDVATLIEHLQATYTDSLDFEPEPEPEEDA